MPFVPLASCRRLAFEDASARTLHSGKTSHCPFVIQSSVLTARHTQKKSSTGTVPIKSVPLTSRISFIKVLLSPVANPIQPQIHPAPHSFVRRPDHRWPNALPHKPDFRATNHYLLSTTHQSLLTNHRLSNSQLGRFAPIVTRRKQTIPTLSNSQLLALLEISFSPSPPPPATPLPAAISPNLPASSPEPMVSSIN